MTTNDKPRRPGKPFSTDRMGKSAPKRDGGKPGGSDATRARQADMKTGGDKLVDEAAGGKAERISKVMARAGVASRRDVERMIMDGRVKLNGVLIDSPVVNVTLADHIEVDGAPIRGIERTRLWLYHKPAGLVTTNSDPEGRPTVFDNLPEELPRVLSIGRLDINTEGLLLLTNDGGLARVLELPATGWLRRYRVRAHGEIDQEALDKLKDGIAVDGVLYGAIEATLDRTQGSNVWITMSLREGKNREIKNVLGALGLDVNRLIRVSYGPFQLGDLPEAQVIEVRGRTLRDQLGPRLIEEAKANFDAPLYGAPAAAADNGADADDREPAKADREKGDRGKSDRDRGERTKWEKPADKRERALGRLDTRRDERRGDDRRGDDRRKDEDRPKRPPLGQRRSANVWMAPGARPLGEKAAKQAAKNAKTDARRGRPDRPQGGAADRPAPAPRPLVNRVREEDGEWIRSSEVARTPRDEGEGFERKRFSGDRPRGERGPRLAGDRPSGARPSGDRPRTRSFGGEGRPEGGREERPRGDRPFGGKPRGERGPRPEGGDRPRAKSFGGEARSDRPYSDRPRSDRPYSDRPQSDRPRGDRPFGDKPSGNRSSEDRPFGKKPGGKSFGGKPGGKSFGGKPGGRPAGGKGFSGRPSGGAPRGGGPRGGGRGGKG